MRFEALSREYATLWDSMEIVRLESSIKRTAERIVAARARYEAVQALTNVPWFVVGIIHALETGLRFDRHLHNGDPLAKPTKLVPANRPRGPGPFTFEESCRDALCMKGYDTLPDWTVERIAWALERYNGWGYRKYHPDTLSPYLWSGSNHYRAGKYVADGKWSAVAVSSQAGAMPLMRAIAGLCPDIEIRSMYEATSDPGDPSPASNASATESASVSTKVGTSIATGGALGGGALLVDPVGTTSAAVGIRNNAQALLAGIDLTTWLVPLLIVSIAAGVLLWASRRQE